ncbi:DDE-type integrase/transposase/recombinase [Legionella gresilensis]|uniref:DDE-type integrase/transposase/recombinase n=1 Tax=Legionella gresilensis TaxID=91823 RepID=UPI00104121FB
MPTENTQQQVKYRNNLLESDRRKLKRLVNPARGFQSMKTTYSTIIGFEVMRMFKRTL